MLIRIFKKNYISQYLVFTILAIVLWIPSFIEPPYFAAQDYTSPLYNLLIGITNHKFIWIVLAFLCLYIQSFLLNSILVYHEILPKSSFLGGFIFFTISSSIIEFQYFHPALIAQFLIIFSIHTLNKMYGNDYHMPETFKTGFLLGVASMFYFPFAVYILLIFASLLLFRVSRIRPWIVPIFSFAAPYLFLFTYYFWFDKLVFFEKYPQAFHLAWGNIFLLDNPLVIYQSLGFVFLFVLSYLHLFAKMFENNLTIRKKIYMISNMFIISAVALLLFNNSIQAFVAILIPMASIVAIYLKGIKRSFWINLLLNALILFTIFNLYNHAFHWI